MATVALDPAYRRVSVDEFLAIDFGGAKAELVDGVIFMMAGGSEEHARIAGNIYAYLHRALRGSGCRPYNSDMATRTEAGTVRYPDVSVYCGDPAAPGNERKRFLGDPAIVVEVLSPSTADNDRKVKLEEYRSLAGTHTILLVDPSTRRVRQVARRDARGWIDEWIGGEDDVIIPALALTIPLAEIFARD